ncbi:MAG: hypothetical protein WCB68_21595, partial [Pyrinomonadaceae bacterium]
TNTTKKKKVVVAVSAEEAQMVCDEKYVEEVKAEGTYPPAYVDLVWGRLLNHCQKKSTKLNYLVRPKKYQFHWWLENELTPIQQPLIDVGRNVAQPDFQAGPQTSPQLREPDPNCVLCGGSGEVAEGRTCPCRNCQFCFGTGMENPDGTGSRRCRCRNPAEAVSQEELDQLEREYDEAMMQLKQSEGGR